MSKSHANRGKGWERLLTYMHTQYKRHGRAAIRHAHPPFKTLNRLRGGVVSGHFESTGPCDFFGVLEGGRAVAFDAKDSSKDRWPFSAMGRHQANHLEEVEEMDGIAFIALRLQGDGWVVPWTWLRGPYWAWATRGKRRAKAGEASIGAAELERHAMKMPELGNWLAVFEVPRRAAGEQA